MSTYIYLRCQNHTPPLEAEDESGQHLYDLPRIRQELIDRKTLAAELDNGIGWHRTDGESSDRYFRRHSARFLRQHLTCDIRIVTEYGDDVTDPEEENNDA